ncbi:MAG: DUF3017 domain-containing protein [Streptosporangiaceae bacterium]
MRHAARAGRRPPRAARGTRVSPAAHRPGRSSGPAAAGPGGTGSRPRLGELPYVLVLGGLGLGLLTVHGGEQDVRSGTLVVAGMLLAAAVARLVLPESRAGMLGSRRRLADVAILAALGAGILVGGLILPAPA